MSIRGLILVVGGFHLSRALIIPASSFQSTVSVPGNQSRWRRIDRHQRGAPKKIVVTRILRVLHLIWTIFYNLEISNVLVDTRSASNNSTDGTKFSSIWQHPSKHVDTIIGQSGHFGRFGLIFLLFPRKTRKKKRNLH